MKFCADSTFSPNKIEREGERDSVRDGERGVSVTVGRELRLTHIKERESNFIKREIVPPHSTAAQLFPNFFGIVDTKNVNSRRNISELHY